MMHARLRFGLHAGGAMRGAERGAAGLGVGVGAVVWTRVASSSSSLSALYCLGGALAPALLFT